MITSSTTRTVHPHHDKPTPPPHGLCFAFLDSIIEDKSVCIIDVAYIEFHQTSDSRPLSYYVQ